MHGTEPRYNDLRYNDIPGLTLGTSLTERKIFPVITIKSISQTTGNAIIPSQYGITKQTFVTLFQNNNYKLFEQ